MLTVTHMAFPCVHLYSHTCTCTYMGIRSHMCAGAYSQPSLQYNYQEHLGIILYTFNIYQLDIATSAFSLVNK